MVSASLLAAVLVGCGCGVTALVAPQGAAAQRFAAGHRRSVVVESASGADDLEMTWRAYSKPLLRVGNRTGVKDSHRRSLEELLEAHGHVCVKFNGFDAETLATTAKLLETATVSIVLSKGNHVLFKGVDDEVGVFAAQLAELGE